MAADHQWNLMQPGVEDMDMKFARLQAMSHTAADATKPAIEKISATSKKLIEVLDQNCSVPTSKVKTYAQELVSESERLERAAKS